MRRLFALYINELIKTSRKISIVIILAIMVLMVAGGGALVRFEEYQSTKYSSSSTADTSWQRTDMQNQLTSLQSQMTDLKTKIKSASPEDLPTLQNQQQSLQDQIDMYQYGLDHGIFVNEQSYLASALRQLSQFKSDVRALSAVPAELLTADEKATLSREKDYLAKLQTALDNKDFAAYTSVANDIIARDDSLSDGEKQLQTEMNNLRLKLNITGENSSTGFNYSEQLISMIENDRRALLTNVDTANSTGPKVLTADRRHQMTDDIAVYTYQLEHKIGLTRDNSFNYRSNAMQTMFQLGGILLIILMMILAGSSVSQELSTGSIKSLIIAPARRWKIFTAKFLCLLTVLLLSALVMFGVASLTYGLLFGFTSGDPYIYAISGTAHEMNFYLFNFAFLFAGLIQVFVYTVLAFMLSIITRNTAASVGISMAVYFGGGIVNSLLAVFAKGEWLKFLPFTNMDIASKIFPSSASQAVLMSSGVNLAKTTLSFALIYLAVLVFCMGYTAFDSFTRRDIK